MRISVFIAEIQNSARHAAQKRYAPVNENGHSGIGHELHNARHDNCGKLIGIAGARGVIADGIGEAPAALLRIETPARVKYRLDELAPQIYRDPGAGNSGVGQGGESNHRFKNQQGNDDDEQVSQACRNPKRFNEDSYRRAGAGRIRWRCCPRTALAAGNRVPMPRLRQARPAEGRQAQARAWCLRL